MAKKRESRQFFFKFPKYNEAKSFRIEIRNFRKNDNIYENMQKKDIKEKKSFQA